MAKLFTFEISSIRISYEYQETIEGYRRKNDEEIIPGIGRTLDQSRKESQENVEGLYREAFSKGVFMVYQDDRVKSEDQFIRANPDGSEDLVEFDEYKSEWHLVSPLVGSGQGRWAYLSPHK
ncbi:MULTISPECIES: hypothetical protein [Cyclobacteriaceae]|uniref:Uncharacterized protein n=2 Tax=Cyclobacteriaceae TaxID=563798 RepID=A0ABV9T093_9BACT